MHACTHTYTDSGSCAFMINYSIPEAMKGLGSGSKHQRFKKDDVVDFITATLDDDSDSISLISEVSSSHVSVQSSNTFEDDLTRSSRRTRQTTPLVVKIDQIFDDSEKKSKGSKQKKSVTSSKQSINKRTATADISVAGNELLEKRSRTEPRHRSVKLSSNQKSASNSASKGGRRKVQPVLIKRISDSDYVSFRNDTPDSVQRKVKRGLRTAFEKVSQNNTVASPRLDGRTSLRKSRRAADNAK